jgi:hypothetical protein
MTGASSSSPSPSGSDQKLHDLQIPTEFGDQPCCPRVRQTREKESEKHGQEVGMGKSHVSRIDEPPTGAGVFICSGHISGISKRRAMNDHGKLTGKRKGRGDISIQFDQPFVVDDESEPLAASKHV